MNLRSVLETEVAELAEKHVRRAELRTTVEILFVSSFKL